jgi:hypothetical protein
MSNKDPLRKRLERVFAEMKEVSSNKAAGARKIASKEDHLLFAMAYAGPVVTAFEKAGLDIEDSGDWGRLVIYFCAAAYGKGAGRPKEWSFEEYERLLKDVADIKKAHPNYAEKDCCKLLLKNNKGTYNKVEKTSTLRRRLQTAKHWSNFRTILARLVTKGVSQEGILRAQQKLNNMKAKGRNSA